MMMVRSISSSLWIVFRTFM